MAASCLKLLRGQQGFHRYSLQLHSPRAETKSRITGAERSRTMFNAIQPGSLATHDPRAGTGG